MSRNPGKLFVFLSLGLLPWLWLACASPNTLQQGPKLCSSDGDCAPGQSCISNFCIAASSERSTTRKEQPNPTERSTADGGGGTETTQSEQTNPDGNSEQPTTGENPITPDRTTEQDPNENVNFDPPPIEQNCTDEDGDGYCANQGDANLRDCNDKDKNVHPGAKELCNGLDDNCNGQIDESFPEAGDACQSGQPGVCAKGAKVCNKGKVECEAIAKPSDELCDGQDNNCNGTVDESPKGAGEKCTTNQPGICAEGKQACENGALVCKAEKTAKPEECNGLDDDCDGQVDEGPCECKDGETQACYTGAAGTDGKGPCKKGSQTCQNNTWGACTGEITPSPETCDGKDNDCDGKTDEDLFASGEVCQTSQPGICATGKKACKGGQVVCEPNQTATTETCNQKDDDCDGQTDEGGVCGVCRAGDTQECYSGTAGTAGIGECKKGKQACDSNGQWGNCTGEVLPTAELCDGKDNDCNGAVDDAVAGQGDACQTGKPGICATGKKACKGGQAVCEPDQQPTTETCNQRDDDCDGTVDEDGVCGACRPNTTRQCYSGPSGTAGNGPCKAGTQTCGTNRQWGTCVGEVLPTTETCDGQDNDCDGTVDNGVGTLYYRDQDGDTYGDPNNSRRACSRPSGYITRGGDCDDSDADARPNQWRYFTSARNGGGYDYNCNKQEEPRFEKASCYVRLGFCLTNQGFVTNDTTTEIPKCGQQGRFLTRCVTRNGNCVPDPNSVQARTQECR